MKLKFPAAVPEIPVTDVGKAAEYYESKLGFSIDWSDEELGIAGISKGQCRMFLANGAFREQHGNLGPVLIWLNLDSNEEVDELHEQWKTSQAKIISPPESKPWGLHELMAADLDGNLLRVFHDFGTPSRLAEAGCDASGEEQAVAATTRVTQSVNAPRASVYRALLDANDIAAWRVPTGMSCHVHAFEPREGGAFRVSLTYDQPIGTGKTTPHTDTYHGRFVKLVPDEQVVEIVEFETADPAMQGEMRITTTLTDSEGGTRIVSVHEGLPPGLSPADNEAGSREAFAKLAALVEGR